MVRSNRRGREVAEGQVYVKQGRGGGIWTVVALRDDGLGAQHAQMRRMDEPNTFRTIAIQVAARSQTVPRAGRVQILTLTLSFEARGHASSREGSSVQFLM